MQRNKVIVAIQPCTLTPIVRGNLKKLCDEFGFNYHTLSRKKFPFTHQDMIIHKVDFI